jgi:hypothetical protein
MATVSREQIRSLVIQAFRQRGITIRHLEILPLAHDGGWTIGPAMLPSISAPPVKSAANDITYELGVLYQLERRERGERHVMVDDGNAESRPIKVLVVADNAWRPT